MEESASKKCWIYEINEKGDVMLACPCCGSKHIFPKIDGYIAIGYNYCAMCGKRLEIGFNIN